jgi:hypothetical protein
MSINCPSAAILVTALSLPLHTLAALGGSVDMTLAGSAQAKAATRIAVANEKYRVYETQTPAGILVKQYSSADGVVFAVTWKGPIKPDMQQLLGAYFPQYTEAQAHGEADRRHMRIREPELVLQSDGRMRAFSGKAYLPQKLPAGVNVDELQ